MTCSVLPRIALVVLAALPAACSLAPHYERPALQAGERFAEEAGAWMPVPADAAPLHVAWWKDFDDAKLADLEDRLPAGSADLKAAVARLEQARAVARGTQSALFPSLGAGASATRQRRSANAPSSGGVAVTGNDFRAGLDLSWELDLFGRLRDASAAADRRAEGAAADLAAVELALRAQLASSYFELRGADATARLLDDSLQLYGRALDLTRQRHASGIAAATDVDQAQAQLSTAQAQRAAVSLRRSQLEHAIAVLLGETPSRFSLPAATLAARPLQVQPGLPSLLLQRRPDIARAERAVAAANAEVGVARAAWFPVFGFGAGLGQEATTSPVWFDAPSRFWSVGPSVRLPLLDAGARSAGTRRAHAVLDEAVARYRQSALVAYQEVEDGLSALHHLADAQASSETAAAAALSSARHADERYAAGIADFLEVATTRANALSAQRAALDARVGRLTASVALVRALGGGWTLEAQERATR